MATTNVQMAQFPTVYDIPVLNKTGSDIDAGTVLSIDSSNLMSNALTSVTAVCVKPSPTGSDPALAFAVALDAIKDGQTGRARGPGGIALVKCDGAVTAGTVVDASATTAGRVKAHTAAKYSFAYALATGADADFIPALILGPAPNA